MGGNWCFMRVGKRDQGYEVTCALSSMDAPQTTRPYLLFDKGIRAQHGGNSVLLRAHDRSKKRSGGKEHFVPVCGIDLLPNPVIPAKARESSNKGLKPLVWILNVVHVQQFFYLIPCSQNQSAVLLSCWRMPALFPAVAEERNFLPACRNPIP